MLRLFIGLIILCFTSPQAWAQDGIFADFSTTKGDFRVQLDYEKAPKTVANFIGLATGSRPWVDAIEGKISTEPFYDGITFHRVVPNFVIQAGSPNGQGNDGPGYQFGNEFHPDLLHDSAGVISMANSDSAEQNRFNTNGSQFFITLRSTPELNGKHSVFGRVVSGIDVVNDIGLLETGTGNPIVTINSVTIDRVGTAAQAFDETLQGLPDVSYVLTTIESSSPTQAELLFDGEALTSLSFFRSSNLFDWSLESSSALSTEPTDGRIDVSNILTSETRQFFRLAKAQYPVIEPAKFPSFIKGKIFGLYYQAGENAFGTLKLSITGDPGSVALVGQHRFTSASQVTTVDDLVYYEWIPVSENRIGILRFLLNSDTNWVLRNILFILDNNSVGYINEIFVYDTQGYNDLVDGNPETNTPPLSTGVFSF